MSERNQLYSLIGKITIGSFFLGLVVVGAALAYGWFSSLTNHHYINFYSSPSGRMKASHVVHIGGTHYHCSEVISVTAASADETEIIGDQFEVYSSSDCDTFADHSASPKIEWISDEMLKISFSINATAASPRTVQLKKQDLSGRILIEFAAHR